MLEAHRLLCYSQQLCETVTALYREGGKGSTGKLEWIPLPASLFSSLQPHLRGDTSLEYPEHHFP